MGKTRIVLLVVCAGLVTLEIGIRVYDSTLAGPVGMLSSYLVHKDGYWITEPNLTVVQPERYGDRVYRFNEYGFRDHSHPLGTDSCAILFVGDSVTFGLGSEQGSRFTELIATELATTCETCRYEVISLSQPGYGPAEELAATIDVGLSYRPRLLVLQLYMNDFAPTVNESAFAGSGRLSRGVAIASNWLFAHSASLRRFRQWLYGAGYFALHDLRRQYAPQTLNAAEPEVKKAVFERYGSDEIPGFEEVEKIYQLARSHQIEVVAILTPSEVQLYRDDFDSINKRIHDFCARKGIPLYDPLPSLRLQPLKSHAFLDGLHLSATGHAFMAQWLLPIIRDHLSRVERSAACAGKS